MFYRRVALEPTWLDTVIILRVVIVFLQTIRRVLKISYVQVLLGIYVLSSIYYIYPSIYIECNHCRHLELSDTRIKLRIHPRRMRRFRAHGPAKPMQQRKEREPAEEDDDALRGEGPGPSAGGLPRGDEELAFVFSIICQGPDQVIHRVEVRGYGGGGLQD